jgi:glycosyltransferase involved in cell wall biosynthesis
VIPTKNRKTLLSLALESVLSQTYKPVEIIVIDDGSTDGTREMLASYKNAVRVIEHDAKGVATARTVASRAAEGSYIAYQDDDDLMPSDRIQKLLEGLETFPQAVLATGDYALIDEQGELTGARWFPGPLSQCRPPRLIEDGHEAILWPRVPAVPHTTLFRAADGERVGWFDVAFRYACSDADFLARLARLGPIVHVGRVVSYYRRGHAAIWGDDLKANHSRLQLWLKHLSLRDDNVPLQSRLRDRMLQALRLIARREKEGFQLDEPSLGVYRDRALKEIGRTRRARLIAYASVELPVRQVLRETLGR